MSETEVDTTEIELDLSYGEALSELDQILAELESSAVDVDVLAERVARGAVLVRFCRNRLHTVRADVEAVVDELLDDAPPPGDEHGQAETRTDEIGE